MTTFIPCPNGGRCGSQNHDPSLQAYKDCLRTASNTLAHSPSTNRVNTAPPIASQPENLNRIFVSAFSNGELRYNSDHLIDRDDRLTVDEVQAYLDGDDDLYSDIYDKMNESIYEDVDNCLDTMLCRIGIDPDDVDTETRMDMICAAMHYDEADIIQKLAENTPQRLLRANNTRLSDAYEKANNSYEKGTDEWYDSISSAVWDRDIKGVMEWDSAEQEAEDKKAFQEAFKDLEPDYIHEDVAVSLLWGGSITDAAPSFEGDKELSINHPHLVFVDGYNGTFNETEKMKGMARIIIPDARKDADLKHRVIDDESEGMYGSVYKMGGLNIDAFRSRTLTTKL